MRRFRQQIVGVRGVHQLGVAQQQYVIVGLGQRREGNAKEVRELRTGRALCAFGDVRTDRGGSPAHL